MAAFGGWGRAFRVLEVATCVAEPFRTLWWFVLDTLKALRERALDLVPPMVWWLFGQPAAVWPWGTI